MPTVTNALSVPAAGAPFEAVRIERRDLRDDDVRIDIAYAGICHSDIHTVRDEWGAAHYPIVTGHEIAGTVSAVGEGVTAIAVGDRVGVGCLVDSCGECGPCKDGQEMFCTKPAVGTYNSRDYHGEWTAGGYSQQIVVTERMVVRIPDALSLDVAAPLLCAGITTYSPLKRWGAGPGVKVAVVGVGGLGHMGVKIAAALGAQVTTISRTDAKAADAMALGATSHLATSDPGAVVAARGSFDLILNTVSAPWTWRPICGCSGPTARWSTSACRASPTSCTRSRSSAATRSSPVRRSAGSRRRRRCWTSAPRMASVRPSRCSTPPTPPQWMRHTTGSLPGT